MSNSKITVMGSYITDLMSRASRLPVIGETVKGNQFRIGPGGKGSNQGVAAKRAGADVTMITKIGRDQFGDLALDNFNKEGITSDFIFIDEEYETGTALIMVDEKTSDNMIIVTPGACNNITDMDIEKARESIENCSVFLTQLETNMSAIEKSLDIATCKGVKIIFNPAPAANISDNLLKKIDIITPNETEASFIAGINVENVSDADKAAQILLKKGVKNVIITLGSKGAYITNGDKSEMIKSISVNAIDTTGAGDAFNGGLAAAIAEGMDIFQAARFACITGSLSTTKIGTAPAMPYRSEIEKYLQ